MGLLGFCLFVLFVCWVLVFGFVFFVVLTSGIGYPVLAGYPVSPKDEEYVLVNNKCQCVTVTSKFVPSKENPDEEVLERNIRIM